MDVEIDEVVSTVTAVDDEALLAPAVLRQILQAVLRAVREERAHEERVRGEQRINAGRDASVHPS